MASRVTLQVWLTGCVCLEREESRLIPRLLDRMPEAWRLEEGKRWMEKELGCGERRGAALGHADFEIP